MDTTDLDVDATIPVGYMAKRVQQQTGWLKNNCVEEICSVSGCISEDFADYSLYWTHNGYWLFDSPEIIRAIAVEQDIDLGGTRMFYYEAYPLQFNERELSWERFVPEDSFDTNVVVPKNQTLLGYDIVSFSAGNAPECSYLSCNHMAEHLDVNRHCLLDSLKEAKQLMDRKVFTDCEPGPCRIFAVYEVPGCFESTGKNVASSLQDCTSESL